VAFLGYAYTAVNFLQAVSSPKPIYHGLSVLSCALVKSEEENPLTTRLLQPFSTLSTQLPVRKGMQGQVSKVVSLGGGVVELYSTAAALNPFSNNAGETLAP